MSRSRRSGDLTPIIVIELGILKMCVRVCVCVYGYVYMYYSGIYTNRVIDYLPCNKLFIIENSNRIQWIHHTSSLSLGPHRPGFRV